MYDIYITPRIGIATTNVSITRAVENPKKFLNGFKEYLQVDGYTGYYKVESLTIVGCLAHARRRLN
ncbi:hypothetical protein FAY30_12000 [Bacillus sp. S3]|uniref:IS66 family transposase n=1 Tax=Bacillus sp. S3 TaxID=486398 RepID=UPI001187D1D4|nr:hypothetical protein FAY30_12000 [Bacillus sp. S3]